MQPFKRTKESLSEGVVRSQAIMSEVGHTTDWVQIGSREFMVMVCAGLITSQKTPDKYKGGKTRPVVERIAQTNYASVIAVDFRDDGDTDDEAFEIERYTGQDIAIASRTVPGGGFIRLRMVTLAAGETIYGEVRLSREDGGQ